MKTFLLIFLAAVVASAAPQPFNILFVLSDDHSAPHMGCYGDPNVVTPNFDRFATEAVRFKRAYTTAPQCAPSRKSILSGRSPVGLQQTLFTLPLQADVVLFPELLKKEKGYHIGLAGRSHHLDGDSHDPLTSEIHKTHNLKTTAKRFDYCKIATGKNGNELGTIREDLRNRLVEWMILERDHLPLPLKPKPKPNAKKHAPVIPEETDGRDVRMEI